MAVVGWETGTLGWLMRLISLTIDKAGSASQPGSLAPLLLRQPVGENIWIGFPGT